MSKIDEMRSGFETAYTDEIVASNSKYRSGFVFPIHQRCLYRQL